jgi:hypothetical protein
MMSDHILNNADHWRKRAEQTRALAERMTDPIAKGLMSEIAGDYGMLARLAEERANEAARAKFNASNDE